MPTTQEYLDRLRRKRLEALARTNQRQNVAEAEQTWGQEDVLRGRMIGSQAEKDYFGRMHRRQRAAESEALLGGEPIEAARGRMSYQGGDQMDPQAPAGNRRPNNTGDTGEPNKTLTDKLALESLYNARLRNQAIGQREYDQTGGGQTQQAMDRESEMRRQMGVSSETSPDQLREMGATRDATIKGKAGDITAGYERQNALRDLKVEEQDPTLRQRRELAEQKITGDYKRKEREGVLDALKGLLGNRSALPPDIEWARGELQKLLGGGASDGGTAPPKVGDTKQMPDGSWAAWDGTAWVER